MTRGMKLRLFIERHTVAFGFLALFFFVTSILFFTLGIAIMNDPNINIESPLVVIIFGFICPDMFVIFLILFGISLKFRMS